MRLGQANINRLSKNLTAISAEASAKMPPALRHT